MKSNKEIKKIKLASRSSALAKYQCIKVLNILLKKGYHKPSIKYLITSGDRLSYDLFKKNGGKGLFTKEIDQLVISKKVDIGVHSLKDIPGIIDKNITIGAVFSEEDARDVLVTKNMNIENIKDLPVNSTFASSSPRRIAFIKNLRPDILVKPLRGNVKTRIKKINNGYAESTILALAGLKRLNLKNYLLFPISINQIIPSPGQGIIALVHRKDNFFAHNICKKIDDQRTRIRVNAERAFLKKIGGDCNTALAAYAEITGNNLVLRTKIFSQDSQKCLSEVVSGTLNESIKIGKNCAQLLLEKGAKKLLTSNE